MAAEGLSATRSAASPFPDEAAASSTGVGGVAVGALEATAASSAAMAGDQFDISRIDLSPSVDVHVVQQRRDERKDIAQRLQRDDSEAAVLGTGLPLELPALSPEPRVGAILSTFQQQQRSEYELIGEPPSLCMPPHTQHVGVRMHQQEQQRSPDSGEDRKESDGNIASPLPLQHAQVEPTTTAPQGQRYRSADQQYNGQLHPHAHPSAYSYSQPVGQWHYHTPPPAAEHRASYPQPHTYNAQPFVYQPPQPSPAVYPTMHHPSMPYYHSSEASLPAHSQPSASHLTSLHSFVHRYNQLSVQRNEVVRQYQQAEETKQLRQAQEHGLLVRHLEHRYEQLQMEIESTEWMLKGNVHLVTAADVPSIQHYAHEAQQRREQQQQRQQRQREQREQAQQDDEEEANEAVYGTEVAEIEAILAQTYKDEEEQSERKSAEESDAQHDEQQELRRTNARNRRSAKRKKKGNGRPYSMSAYIVRQSSDTARGRSTLRACKHVADWSGPPVVSVVCLLLC